MSQPSTIFISYARKDGKPDADKLRQRLTDAGLNVWQDLVAMNIGDNWQPQLYKAIEEADALVMVITPAALTSTMARQEWVHARRVGTPIFPVAFTDIYKLPDVPRWVGKADAVILDPSFIGADDKWQTLIHQLKNPPKPRRVPNMVQKLQPEYVERKALYPAIVTDLLDPDGASPKKSPHHTVLLGEGGFGKTTLAEAVGLDIGITEAYTGGVFFVTIGESASQLNDKWHFMLQALGDEKRYIDPIEQLKLRLKGDDFLIILDDVWDRAHVDPILRLENCNFLITTRDGMIANSIARHTHSIHTIREMTPDEAREVLLKYIPINKRDSALKDRQLVADMHALGVQLGEWALLLDIHGLTMRQECNFGYTVRDALDYVLEGLREEGLSPMPKGTDEDTRRRTLYGSMNASLRRYSDDEKTRIYELSIFPDDTAIPEAIVSRLWTGTSPMGNRACRDLLRRVAGHFCRFRAEHDDETPLVRFHDKIRDYLAGQLPDAPTVHRQFLAKFGVTDWADLPHDEQYLWRNIAYHLLGAEQGAVLRGLLVTYRWLDAKLRATDPNALIDDCDLWLKTTSPLNPKTTSPLNPLSKGRGDLQNHPTNPIFSPFSNVEKGVGGMRSTGQGGEVKDETIRLIRSAISMSAHVLDDKNALAHQLAGRLMHHYKEVDEIRTFLDVVMTTPNNLFPAFPDSEYDIMNPAGGMMLRTMKHDGGVNGAVQLADGRILSWGDKTLRLWYSDGTPIATLKGHTDWVNGALQLADGRVLSWSVDSTLRLWEADGTPIATLEGHTDSVHGAVVLADGRLLSWAYNSNYKSTDTTLRLWDADGIPQAQLMGHTDIVLGAIELSDGRILSWSEDATLRLWDADGTPLATLEGHTDDVTGAVQLGDGRILSWSSHETTLRLWGADGAPVATLTGHTGGVSGAMELRDRRILSWAGHMEIMNVKIMNEVLEFDDVFLPSVVRIEDNTLRLWDADGTPLATLTGHTDGVWGAIELGDGRLLSWSADNTLRLWDADGIPQAQLMGHTDIVLGAIELSDGRILSRSGHRYYVRNTDNTLRLWGADGTLIATLRGHTFYVGGIIELKSGWLLSWGDTTLRLWDMNGTLITTMTGHTNYVNGIIELVDGRLLSWSDDKTLCLWDSDGTPIVTLIGHKLGVNRAIELGDGRFLSMSVHENTLRLWDTNGTLIDVQEDSYYLDHRFAEKHRLETGAMDKIRTESDMKVSIGQWHVELSKDIICVIDTQTKATVHQFYADGQVLVTPIFTRKGLVVAGDGMGRVLFLRWVGV